MSKQVYIQPHLSPLEIESRYRKAKDATECIHWHIIWMKMRGFTLEKISDITGYSYSWIWSIVTRYNQEGPEGMRDNRENNGGHNRLLTDQQQAELHTVLLKKPADGGLWTGAKVAEWIKAKTGKITYPQRGWRYLTRLGMSLQIPRPHHLGSSADVPETKEDFLKNFPTRSNR